MAQYSIHKNSNPNTRKTYPYLINVQSPLLDGLDTRLVIPLSKKTGFSGKPIQYLNPVIVIDKIEYVILTQQMAAIHLKNLGLHIGDASLQHQEILAAIDFLITGF